MVLNDTTESSADLTYLIQIPAVVTCIASGTILLNYYLFKDIRRLRYVEFVFYISVNDFLLALSALFGKCPNQSFCCYYQGMSQIVNEMSSVFWTVVITYQVWVVVNRGSVIKDLTYIHIICWGFPIFCSFLPLTTNTYSNNESGTWCFINDASYSPSWTKGFWYIFALYIWVWLALIINCGLIVNIYWRMRGISVIPQTLKTTVQKLIFYPVVVIICWILITMIDIRYSTTFKKASKDPWLSIFLVGLTLLILQGFFFSVIFYCANPFIRKKWKLLAKKYVNKVKVFCGFSTVEISNNSTFDEDIVVENESDYIPPTSFASERSLENDEDLRFTSTAERSSVFDFLVNISLPGMRQYSTEASKNCKNSTGNNIEFTQNTIVNPINSSKTDNP